MRSATILLALCAALAAQGVTPPPRSVYFSTRFGETPTSGRGGFQGDLTAVCGNPSNLPGSANPSFGVGRVIESVATNAPGINVVVPGVPNISPINSPPGTRVVDFIEVANFTQFNAIIGDLDADGNLQEASNFVGVDAIHIVTPALARLNNVHEMFISSTGDSSGSAGFLGVNITEADMVLLPRATNVYPNPSVPAAPVFFIRQTDWQTFFNIGTNNGIDVNAFTVDPLTGDIYASFDAAIAGVTVVSATGASSVVTLSPGDIVRIPGTAYTPAGVFGVVSAPTGGQAQLYLSATEVQTLINASGCSVAAGISLNVYSLEIDDDPALLAYTTPRGFVGRHLLFTVDNRGGANPGTQLSCASGIYTTANGGTFATINGVVMNTPNAAGMNDLSFNSAFYAGPLDALAVVTNIGVDVVNNKPIHLDTFPATGIITDPLLAGRVTAYASGLKTPGPGFAVFAAVRLVPAGGFVPRWSVAPIGINGFPDLYVDPFGIADSCAVVTPTIFDPFCQFPSIQAFFNSGLNPVWPYVDAVNGSINGDTCFGVDFGPFIASLVPTANLVIVFQGLDLGTLDLSDPLVFTLN